MRREIRLGRLMIAIATSVAIATGLPAQGVVRGGTLPGPLPLFPSDNWWNVDVSDAPVDPSSGAFIAFIGPTRGLHPDLGGDTGDSPPNPLTYGMIYVVVPGDQPLEAIDFYYADESDTGAPGRPPGYPVPVEARTETKWIEGGLAGNDPDADGDRHMLIVDRDHRVLFELYDLHYDQDAGRWNAGSGAIFPLDSNQRRPDGWTSADAAGLAILPGLVRYDEAYGTEPIRHAFRVTVRATDGYVYPASHRAGSTAGALPMGARLRLRASKDISGYPAPVRRIFQAMKSYGLIVADNGSDMYVTGTYDTRWDNDVLNPAFASLKASDFEVIELGWKPAEEPPCTPVSITVQPANTTILRGDATSLSVAASGTTPITIQWYAGARGDASSPLNGETSSSVVVAPIATTTYWARLTNPCKTLDSAAATVTVAPRRRHAVRRP